eukprot:scpid53660/ scgid28254/ Kelch-like protein 8
MALRSKMKINSNSMDDAVAAANDDVLAGRHNHDDLSDTYHRTVRDGNGPALSDVLHHMSSWTGTCRLPDLTVDIELTGNGPYPSKEELMLYACGTLRERFAPKSRRPSAHVSKSYRDNIHTFSMDVTPAALCGSHTAVHAVATSPVSPVSRRARAAALQRDASPSQATEPRSEQSVPGSAAAGDDNATADHDQSSLPLRPRCLFPDTEASLAHDPEFQTLPSTSNDSGIYGIDANAHARSMRLSLSKTERFPDFHLVLLLGGPSAIVSVEENLVRMYVRTGLDWLDDCLDSPVECGSSKILCSTPKASEKLPTYEEVDGVGFIVDGGVFDDDSQDDAQFARTVQAKVTGLCPGATLCDRSKTICSFGGNNRQNLLTTAATYSIANNRWQEHTDVVRYGWSHGQGVLLDDDDSVLCVGGSYHPYAHPKCTDRSVLKYQRSLFATERRQVPTWLSPMSTSRLDFALAPLDTGSKALIAAGGRSHGGMYTSSAEIYTVSEDSWSSAACMSMPRSCCTAQLVNTERVYVVGGLYESFQSPLDTVDVYDIGSNRWSTPGGARLATPRHSSASTVLNGNLFASGGMCDDSVLSSMEMLDTREGKWRQLMEMTRPRANHGMVTMAEMGAMGNIFVFGGYDGRAYLNTAEWYDMRLNRWFNWQQM